MKWLARLNHHHSLECKCNEEVQREFDKLILQKINLKAKLQLLEQQVAQQFDDN